MGKTVTGNLITVTSEEKENNDHLQLCEHAHSILDFIYLILVTLYIYQLLVCI